MVDLTKDEKIIGEALMDARKVQEYLWQELSLLKRPFNMDAWVSVFSKRVMKIANIQLGNKSAKVELRKRVLQQCALSICALRVLDEEIDNEKA